MAEIKEAPSYNWQRYAARKELLQKMRRISEVRWSAGWYSDLELRILGLAIGGDVAAVDIMNHARNVGGIYRWDDDVAAPMFVDYEGEFDYKELSLTQDEKDVTITSLKDEVAYLRREVDAWREKPTNAQLRAQSQYISLLHSKLDLAEKALRDALKDCRDKDI